MKVRHAVSRDYTRTYRNPDDPVSLRDVWIIGDGELNEGGKSAWTYLQDENELAHLHRDVGWLRQALIEFMDLANFNPIARNR